MFLCLLHNVTRRKQVDPLGRDGRERYVYPLTYCLHHNILSPGRTQVTLSSSQAHQKTLGWRGGASVTMTTQHASGLPVALLTASPPPAGARVHIKQHLYDKCRSACDAA